VTARLALIITLACSVPCLGDTAFDRDHPAHVVCAVPGEQARASIAWLTNYLGRVLAVPPEVVESLQSVPAEAPAVVLLVGETAGEPGLPKLGPSPESFSLSSRTREGNPLIIVHAATESGLRYALQRLILKSRQETGGLVVPDLGDTVESPWIEHREWTVCPWGPQLVRGVFVNPYADRRMEIRSYGPEQLDAYVAMMGAFGFNGCQLMETCYNYAVFGSVQADHEWQRMLIDRVRHNGQSASLWVWAAQFSGFGWVDPEFSRVVVPGKGAFKDPATRRMFEKYFDHYAALCPDVQRLFAHFYDPGVLADKEDVFQYLRLLESKAKAKNPRIEMGIDFWAASPDYLNSLIDHGFRDYLLLELSFPEVYPGTKRQQFHEQARKLGLRLGMWGWYTTEYETDQLASMYANAQMLKSVYQDISKGAHAVHPVTYWSEMEATHLVNIFSMYASGQLLWNPNRDPHEILAEITTGIWGPTNGPAVLAAVELIQDVRSGPTWETFWWTRPGHRVGTANPREDLSRATASLMVLSKMKTDPAFVPKFPLPFPPEVFVELMLPHLRQIRQFAEFRLKLDEIRRAARAGGARDVLEAMLVKAWQPIPEYNTWVGVFGNQELRAQKKLVDELAKELHLTVHDPAWLVNQEADRVLQCLQRLQARAVGPKVFSLREAVTEFFWSPDRSADRVEQLVARGVLERVGKDGLRLTNWQDFALASQPAD
jgi:hypothetical protein